MCLGCFLDFRMSVTRSAMSMRSVAVISICPSVRHLFALIAASITVIPMVLVIRHNREIVVIMHHTADGANSVCPRVICVFRVTDGANSVYPYVIFVRHAADGAIPICPSMICVRYTANGAFTVCPGMVYMRHSADGAMSVCPCVILMRRATDGASSVCPCVIMRYTADSAVAVFKFMFLGRFLNFRVTVTRSVASMRSVAVISIRPSMRNRFALIAASITVIPMAFVIRHNREIAVLMRHSADGTMSVYPDMIMRYTADDAAAVFKFMFRRHFLDFRVTVARGVASMRSVAVISIRPSMRNRFALIAASITVIPMVLVIRHNREIAMMMRHTAYCAVAACPGMICVRRTANGTIPVCPCMIYMCYTAD